MQEFTDKVAVVTGAGSGIGRALARRFAREGCKVVLADIAPDALADAEVEIAGSGATTLAVHVDVTDQASVDALASAAVARFGRVDIVCNNAGVGVPRGGGMYVWDTSLAEYDWVMKANVWGIIHGCRAFVPILLEQGGEGQEAILLRITDSSTSHKLLCGTLSGQLQPSGRLYTLAACRRPDNLF